MPKQPRWSVKRKLDQAVGNIETACLYLTQVAERARGQHPEIAESLEGMIDALMSLAELVNSFRDAL